ncbi:MAG: hydrolase TatD, partial [Parabacteroides sp.]|nr:hydrolase TatD [Parabacteroides sp.]
MGLIDTHCHLYLEDFDPEQEQLIEEAKASGIERLLMPNVDL